MAEFVFIRLTEREDAASSVVLDADGRIIRPEHTQLLSELRPELEGRRVIVLVPSSAVVTTDVTMPRAGVARVRQMVPFSLEDSLAADIDTLHFAVGEWTAAGRVTVSVVGKAAIDAWCEKLDASGVTAHAMYSVADGVPDTPATLNLWLEGSDTFCRRPGRPSFVLADLPLSEVVELLRRESDDTADIAHAVVHMDRAALELRQDEVADLKASGTEVDAKVTDSLLSHLGANLVFNPGTNLLQGKYAPKSNLAPLLRPWYAAAGLAAGLLVLALVGQAAYYYGLVREDRALTTQASEICSRGYSSTVLDGCRAEMRRRLSAAGQSEGASEVGFLPTLAAFAANAADSSRIEALNYRNDVMDLQLTVSSVTVLDEMSQRINATQRFTMNVQSSSPQDEGVDSRIQIVTNR
jgi:general secretion pathway protein L